MQIPLKPQKPIWWRVILGSFLIFTTINNRVNPAPNLLKARNATQQTAMNVTAVVIAAVAIWLLISGIRPVWRKISN
jgi:hypothetical protein